MGGLSEAAQALLSGYPPCAGSSAPVTDCSNDITNVVAIVELHSLIRCVQLQVARRILGRLSEYGRAHKLNENEKKRRQLVVNMVRGSVPRRDSRRVTADSFAITHICRPNTASIR